jgi:hypothetical protein
MDRHADYLSTAGKDAMNMGRILAETPPVSTADRWKGE